MVSFRSRLQVVDSQIKAHPGYSDDIKGSLFSTTRVLYDTVSQDLANQVYPTFDIDFVAEQVLVRLERQLAQKGSKSKLTPDDVKSFEHERIIISGMMLRAVQDKKLRRMKSTAMRIDDNGVREQLICLADKIHGLCDAKGHCKIGWSVREMLVLELEGLVDSVAYPHSSTGKGKCPSESPKNHIAVGGGPVKVSATRIAEDLQRIQVFRTRFEGVVKGSQRP